MTPLVAAVGFLGIAMLVLAWCVHELVGAVERHSSRVEAHGNQLAQFGRAVYGSSGSYQAAQATTADADAAAKLAASDEARKSGPG